MCKKLHHPMIVSLLLAVLSTMVRAELVGWWRLDEPSGSTVADSSGKGNNGTCQGAATWVAGQIGGAWQGSTATGTSASYIQIPHSDILNIPNTVTVAFWVNIPTYATAQLLEKGGTAGSAWYAAYGMRAESNGTVRIQWGNTNWNPTSVVPLSTWTHVAMTFDVNGGANNNKVYFNGVQVAERTWSTALTTNAFPLIIGVDNYNSAPRWPFRGMIDDLRIYNEVLPAGLISTILRGGGLTAGISGSPSPANKAADVLREVALAWKPGDYAGTHDVYFGTSFDDVNTASVSSPKGVLVSQGQTDTAFDPAGLLAFGQTYYWRIDEVNATPDATVYRGDVWSFAAEPYAYAIKPAKATASNSHNTAMGPEKTIDGSGLSASDQHSILATDMWLSNVTGPKPAWIQYDFDRIYKLQEMWVWNSNQSVETTIGFGAREVSVEVSTDGTTWAAIPNVPVFNQATGSPDYVHNTTVNLGGTLAQYVRLTIQSNWGTQVQCGLSEVRFFYVPVKAFAPQPAVGATGVALDATLNWRPGREAASHQVFFGTDANAVTAGTAFVQTVTEHQLSLASLSPEYGRTYYWKIDEVNDAAMPKTWAGDLWSFSTVGYGVVDDFESYDNTCSRIFFSWIDGYGHSGSTDCSVPPSQGNGTGSTVGNINPPFAERTIVNSGNQAMPFWYDNTRVPFYSEAVRQWDTAQSWKGGGANTLTVSFRGEAPGFLEYAPGSVVMNGMGTDIWGTVDQGRFAYRRLSGDGSIVAKVESLANTNAWAKVGVMIRESPEAGSTWAYILYGGTNGVHFQARLTSNVAAVSDTAITLPVDQTGARAPVWIKLERKANQFSGSYSMDGKVWTAMVWNPQTITMAKDVYIGLAVTSHAANVVCGARLSGVATTGNVTGAWESADLGVPQVATGNTLEALYVVVQDSGGKTAVVGHPDPAAIASGSWEQWTIPFSQISGFGVNVGSVKRLMIGVGDRSSPKAGGTGKLYIDDIRLSRTAQ